MAQSVKIALLALAAALFSRPGEAPACVSFNNSQTVSVTLSALRPACLTLSVDPGEPTRIVAEQPADIAIRVVARDSQTSFDSFEFGPETATILEAGKYRIELHPVEPVGHLPLTLSMLKTRLPLQRAAEIRKAEELSSKSKLSGKPEEIAASLALWEALGDSAAISRTQLQQGDAAVSAQKSELGGRYYESALAACLAANDTRCIAEGANNSGFTAIALGDFDRALARLKQAAEAWEKLGMTAFEGQTLSNLGLLFWQTGDYQQAIAWFNRAGDLLRSRDAIANARVLNNLGLCYLSLEENAKARYYFQSALDGFLKAHSQRDSTRARLNLGHTWLVEGDAVIARGIFLEALTEATRNADRSAHADILENMGRTLLVARQPAEARKTLGQAFAIHRTLLDKRMEGLDLFYLGVAARDSGDRAAARDFFAQSLAIRQECGLRDAAVDSLFSLADLEHADGNAGSARNFADQAIAAMESVRVRVPGPELRASWYSRKRRFFDLLIDLAGEADPTNAPASGFLAAERGRGRALLDLLAEGNVLSGAPADLIERRAGVQRRIDFLAARISVATPAIADPLRQQVEQLVAEAEGTDAEIRQKLSDPRLGGPLTSVAQLQNALPKDTAVLEYYIGERRSFLWLVDRGHIQVFPLPDRKQIEAESAPVIELFPQFLERKRTAAKQDKFVRAVRRLSDTLLGPVRALSLPPRLVIVPDGVLTRVPFAALEESAAAPLGLAHDLVQATSSAYLVAGRKPRRAAEFPKTFLAFADPVFSAHDLRAGQTLTADLPDLPRLPFTAEVDAASALVPPSRRRILRGLEASPKMLRTLPLGDYAVVNLSAHAFIDDRIPELSRIALSLGFLRPVQLSELHLNGSTVVLAACDTALGKQVLGEGLSGFTASLFHAGAAQLVLALADVDAEGSSEFLAETYRNMFVSQKTGVEHAMTLARQKLSRSPRWSDPWYWASFTAYGRPGEL